MNGTLYSQDPPSGFYTGHGPTAYYPSTFTPQVHHYPTAYNFENCASNSTDYYNRIHAQIRSNTPATYSRQDTASVANTPFEPTFLVVPGNEMNRASPGIQVCFECKQRIDFVVVFFFSRQSLYLLRYLLLINNLVRLR